LRSFSPPPLRRSSLREPGARGQGPTAPLPLREVLNLTFDLAIPGHMAEEYPFAPATRARIDLFYEEISILAK